MWEVLVLYSIPKNQAYRSTGTIRKKTDQGSSLPANVSAARSLLLCFNVDCDVGLEFHGEVVGEDGDLLDELFDQSLIKLCDIGFLPGDEVLQLLDSIHGFFPVMAVDLGLFLLVAEPENLIGDGIVVLLAVGLSDELLLQLIEPCLDTVRAHRVGGHYSYCDVLLHLSDEAVLVVEYLVERLGCDFLQEFFLDGSAGAAFSFRKM